jgi:hypothetical protein
MSEEIATKKKRNLVPWLIVIILLIGLAVSLFFLFMFRGDYIATTQDLETANELIDNKDLKISSIENELNSALEKISENNKLISDQEALIIDKDNLISKQADEITNLEKDNKSIQNSLNSANRQLDQLICEHQLTNMNYEDILTSSDRLAAFMSSLPDVERTSYTFRNTVWNNAMSKIHGINFISKTDGKVYAMQFLVYYDEFDFKIGTFSIGGQCWVDSPFD